MECSHNNIIQDREARVYRCAKCSEVVGHFNTPEQRKEIEDEARRYMGKLNGIVSIGNGLYANTRKAR